jgi:hypothetical protein
VQLQNSRDVTELGGLCLVVDVSDIQLAIASEWQKQKKPTISIKRFACDGRTSSKTTLLL